MKDASVVTKDTLTTVAAEVHAEAAETNLIQSLTAREPLLAAFVAEKLLAISGKLSLCGAPPEIVQGSYEDVASLVATSVRAIWAGTDELWRGIDLADVARVRRPPRRARPGTEPPAASGRVTAAGGNTKSNLPDRKDAVESAAAAEPTSALPTGEE